MTSEIVSVYTCHFLFPRKLCEKLEWCASWVILPELTYKVCASCFLCQKVLTIRSVSLIGLFSRRFLRFTFSWGSVSPSISGHWHDVSAVLPLWPWWIRSVCVPLGCQHLLLRAAWPHLAPISSICVCVPSSLFPSLVLQETVLSC